MGCPTFTPQNAASPSTIFTHLIHPSLDRPHSPPRTASRSNQPFCHSTSSGQTDRPTDRPTHGITKSRLRLTESDAAKKRQVAGTSIADKQPYLCSLRKTSCCCCSSNSVKWLPSRASHYYCAREQTTHNTRIGRPRLHHQQAEDCSAICPAK